MEEDFLDEEGKDKKIIDIEFPGENRELGDLDVHDFYNPNYKIKIDPLLRKKTDNFYDSIKVNINLSLLPKIRLHKLGKKQTSNDIKISKKIKEINLETFSPKIDENTLDFREKQEKIEYNQNNLYFDIYNPIRPASYYLFKKIKRNFWNITKLSIWFTIFFISVFAYKSLILHFAESGYKNIYSITDSKNLVSVSQNINNAKFDFIVSYYLFLPIDIIFNNAIFSYEPVKNVSNLINWWKYLAKWLDNWAFVFDSLLSIIEKKWAENIYYTEFLLDAKPELDEMSLYLNKALTYYKWVSDLWDEKLNDSFYKAFWSLKYFSENTDYILANYDKLLEILAYNKEKRYLIIFQNSDEIRPTWGFMGSMWVLSIFKWKVKDFVKKDVYAYEWDIKPYREDAPEWINKITDSFWLRDSNYFIDFRDSSAKIRFFMRKAWEKIDWIVYLNNNIILDYLDLLWAVNFKKINKNIDSSNFNFVMSTLVESKIFKVWTLDTPKQVLFDFMQDFYTKLKEEKKYKDYFKVFLEDVSKRDIVFYTFSSKANKFLENYNLNWSLDYHNYLDFVYPVFTSIWGNKSDRYINRTFSINSTQSWCNLENTLSITQTHLFSSSNEIDAISYFNELQITDYKDLLNIQWKWVNKQFVRLLLPKNSIIKNDKVKVIEEENDKIAYFYTEVKPWETSTYTLNYEIENKDCKPYSFKFFKQPGLRKYDLNINNSNWKNISETNLNSDYEIK